MECHSREQEVMVEAFKELTRRINDLVIARRMPNKTVCELVDILGDTMSHALDRMDHLERAAEAERTAELVSWHVAFGLLLDRLHREED